MEQTGDQLLKWHNRKFRGLRREIDKFTKELQSFTDQAPTNESILKEQNIREKLNKLLEQEEAFWHQRSRVSWLREGDRNTSFFRNQASQRKKKKGI